MRRSCISADLHLNERKASVGFHLNIKDPEYHYGQEHSLVDKEILKNHGRFFRLWRGHGPSPSFACIGDVV
jgi:hypothetical protein